jgi:hypothetical protein
MCVVQHAVCPRSAGVHGNKVENLGGGGSGAARTVVVDRSSGLDPGQLRCRLDSGSRCGDSQRWSMNLRPPITALVVALIGCSSSSTGAPNKPVIDSLDVPSTAAAALGVYPLTGTLSFHDPIANAQITRWRLHAPPSGHRLRFERSRERSDRQVRDARMSERPRDPIPRPRLGYREQASPDEVLSSHVPLDRTS